MADPRGFEEAVARELRAEGYATELTSCTNDWGVDIFATRGSERLAVQVKMYAGARPVNRRQVFELHGAAAYFDCTGAVLATDGELLGDADAAAAKLGIRVMRLWSAAAVPRTAAPVTDACDDSRTTVDAVATGDARLDFETIWQRSIVPLVGRTLTRADGSTNRIVAVDWGGVTRITSNGRRQRIGIEIFRWAIECVLERGELTRAQINEQYEGRASSGIALILVEVPEFEVSGRPQTIRLRGARP